MKQEVQLLHKDFKNKTIILVDVLLNLSTVNPLQPPLSGEAGQQEALERVHQLTLVLSIMLANGTPIHKAFPQKPVMKMII
ncbi:Uncharacterised protein [Escherichia coli]|uniref:Uncharacterized protein n=1 Tax=Escherichia coli TaxID=562 RepID=A0A376W275_ECOLX|nr:Uncharacterised protein [Escherichia coli]